MQLEGSEADAAAGAPQFADKIGTEIEAADRGNARASGALSRPHFRSNFSLKAMGMASSVNHDFARRDVL